MGFVFASCPSAGLFIGEFIYTLCLSLLGLEVFYMDCGYSWEDEVVDLARYIGAHAAPHAHAQRGEVYTRNIPNTPTVIRELAS